MLLAVAGGSDYQQAARSAGRRSGDAVSHLVARFNAEGLAALSPRHGGGQPLVYDQAARQRDPPRGRTRSDARGRRHGHLVALAPCGSRSERPPTACPRSPTSTIWQVLHESGRSYQQSRTWCPTGSALRKRMSGTAVVTDPDAESKKS